MNQLHDGVSVRVGLQDLIVPALTLRQVKKYRDVLRQIGTISAVEPTDEEVDGVIGMVHAALSRNYPELTLEQLQDAIDLRSLPKLIAAVVAQTDLEKVQAPASGEPASLSTGTP